MTSSHSRLIVPVILSGGAGTRLWPLSREDRPKQMHALAGPDSLLRRTRRRVEDPGLYAPPILVAAEAQADAIETEVPDLARLILEPCPRNTAAAIALAALSVEPEALLLVLPSDHLIDDPAALNEAVRRAQPFAEAGWIVTFGMRPTRAETGYGYVERGALLGDGVHEAVRFVEKPDSATARAYVEGGRHDWNGGLFLMRADRVLSGLASHAPDIAGPVREAAAGARVEGRRWRPDGAAFARTLSRSIDVALMEKDEKVALVPVEIGWSDIGSFQALHEAMARDGSGNAVQGEALAIDARDCLILSEGPLVAAIGISDLIVVAVDGAVLVVPRDQSQRVKTLVERLKQEGKI